MCLLHIDIEENLIMEAFTSLHFDILAITAPHYSIFRGAFAVSKRVYTKEVCAAPGGAYTTGA
jgi:hypothetical protein